MRPLHKGLVLAGLHLALVSSLGVKLLHDRATWPRVWVRTAPVDPHLPIRGRYVSLQLEVHAPGVPRPAKIERWAVRSVLLRVENNQLVAVPEGPERPGGAEAAVSGGNYIRWQGRPGNPDEVVALLGRPVAYFIPEHVSDPARRPQGEELWVEVTVPKKGPPRPIRLGVKKGGGPITLLDLN